ncbi:MAG TPA: class I SAM-dependent methyltransferase [Rhodobacteraceae bacterium]|nr:class I SAM-dependent methyltransferase [Paracoccaceae bacterium]
MISRTHSDARRPKDADWELSVNRQSGGNPERTADWSAYAETYDLLLEHNPAYQELLAEFEAFLAANEPPQVIYDVGGGTGNYAQIAARMCPESSIYFIEPDRAMRERAKAKLAAHANVTYIDRALQDVRATAKADLVICVHALYSMPEPQDRLGELRGLLRPGGLLFLIDLGRQMNVRDWRSYLFSHLTKELGILGALQILWKGREIAKQNKAIFKAQQEGLYWTHTESEIASAVEKAGFDVISRKPVYRGYSDYLLCRAAP